MIKCKIADGENCRFGLNICCGICEHRQTCDCGCECYKDFAEAKDCPEAEVISDDPNVELVKFQSAVPAAIQLITAVVQQKKELEDQEKELKAQLVKAMETFGVKSFENDLIKLTYVAPTTRSSIDSAKLKKDHPDIAQQYTKVSDVAASVRINLK